MAYVRNTTKLEGDKKRTVKRGWKALKHGQKMPVIEQSGVSNGTVRSILAGRKVDAVLMEKFLAVLEQKGVYTPTGEE